MGSCEDVADDDAGAKGEEDVFVVRMEYKALSYSACEANNR